MIFCLYRSSTVIFSSINLLIITTKHLSLPQHSSQNLTICHIFNFGILLEIVVSVQTSGVCD